MLIILGRMDRHGTEHRLGAAGRGVGTMEEVYGGRLHIVQVDAGGIGAFLVEIERRRPYLRPGRRPVLKLRRTSDVKAWWFSWLSSWATGMGVAS